MKKIIKKIVSITFINKVRLLLNIKYRFAYNTFNESTRIVSTEETVNTLIMLLENKKKGAYLRFGDGDLFILKNMGEARNQKFNESLSVELKQAISLSGSGVMKSLAIHSEKFGMDEHMEPGIHERPNWEAEKFALKSYEFFIGCQIFSPVAMHYQIVYNKDLALKLFRILKSSNPIFVGSEKNDVSVIANVLGSGAFIQTPHRNSYQDIDRIESAIVKEIEIRNKDFDVVVLSCGSTAKALIKRLHLDKNKKVFLFDMGSVIDLFHGRNTWAWVKKSGITNDYLNSFIEELNS
ncbi:hypothetical protein GCM10008107_02880 [Psychrosphaera saromensis]|uniref:Uncharacterized protein n=1 Tax=Psychrosphaera saromensis TaxID=716813 RepID=A0A2S7UXN5_9GAMM|nr:GT-D fold domain-containing glycosyltransferase [Psychrosphaera saromensis]PQJ54756.1 hypothetical protein BTO11_14590 [Psychrosphaera saromensis]GHB57403.1 hypothetical protein GCM10008107_02880 [Psychrosphaera saromensis]GLQ14010.1 hypothetical protein GCM10007917_14650 [Psychrosphaera saromensis]